MKKVLALLLIPVLLLSAAQAVFAAAPAEASRTAGKTGTLPADGTLSPALRQEIAQYNHVIGTNAFAPSYQFTDADPIMEVADQILAWGSNMIKFTAGKDDGVVDRILEGRDFSYVFIWYRSEAVFRDGYSEEEAREDYDAFYGFTQKLLRTYDGTGKQFYLGHWEGDWYYTDNYNGNQETVDETVTRGMIDWINNRQKAVDDAKRGTPHSDVDVWNYLEINRPMDAMNKGYDRVVNRVLPYTDVDYVSYSAYDAMNESTGTIRRVVDYIYRNLPEKSGVPGPRVFIGEAAAPASRFGYDDGKHCEANLRIITKFLRCDVRFFLYWEMYCNETLPDGRANGYWLIDSDGNKTQLYRVLQDVFNDGKEFVETFAGKHGRVPTNQEYRSWLLRRPAFAKARIGVFFEDIYATFRSLFGKLAALFRLPDTGSRV